ncbi:hypothetical protein C8R44DRAFT_877041 [Mycena epipterygia]|nr:hypothetical protein C8R44DRAFT_877041 [Mycena epipterygia]
MTFQLVFFVSDSEFVLFYNQGHPFSVNEAQRLTVLALDVNSGNYSMYLLDGGVTKITPKLSGTYEWEVSPPFNFQANRSLAVLVTRRNRFKFWLGRQRVGDILISYTELETALKQSGSLTQPYYHKIDSTIPVLLTVTSDDIRTFAEEAMAAAQNKTYILDRLGVSQNLLDRMVEYSTALSEIHPVAKTLQRTQALGIAQVAQLGQAIDTFMCSKYSSFFEDRMPPAYTSQHRSRCLPGTRKDVLHKIHCWATDLNASNNLWLTGYPGAGKTTLSFSLLDSLPEPRCHFFFCADNRESTPSALWLTIASRLSRLNVLFGKFAVENMEKGKAEIFRHLISDPLGRIGTSLRLVVVVDAIDECVGITDQDYGETEALLNSLIQWSHLPPGLKLIVTSRNDHAIARVLQPISRHLELELNGQNTSDDIRLFLETGFRKIKSRHARTLAQLEQWPEPGVIEELTQDTGGLFIWPETLLRFLEHDSEKRLARIRKGDMGSEGRIFVLYQRILDISFLQTPERPDLGDILAVLGAIISSPTPLTFQEYVHGVMPHIRVSASTFDDICRRLRSVLDNDAPDDIVRFHHKSFVDFLLSPSFQCPPELRLDMQEQQIKITAAYLRTLQDRLGFNICKLESSYELHNNVPDLADRIEKHIPAYLSHASAHWTDHLAVLPAQPSLQTQIQNFLETNFLYWLEVCSLTDGMDHCSGQLSLLRKWAESDYLVTLAEDAYKFVETSKDVISTSIPHIYISALSFTPPTSKIFQIYKARFSGGFSVRLNEPQGGKHRHPITCVAFSPLGCIASASQDRTIRLWTINGKPVLEPLVGHTRTVTCISFSEDGKRIVSGSRDHTARLWDVETGKQIAKFEQHTDVVTGVVFSTPFIVSVSRDQTLRVWTSTAEREYTNSSQLSKSALVSVASLGAHRLVVCIEDSTMILVKIKLRRGSSSQGHGSSEPVRISTGTPVICLSSSPDGTWFATGDKEGTVRKWDVASNRDVCIMPGRCEPVTTVAATARRIASGSEDGTLRIWDSDSGQLLLGPFRAHGPISSIAISPIGTILVSASDASLRLWELGEIYSKAQPDSQFTDECELRDDWRLSEVVIVAA